jgi:hypothetical protein
MGMRRTIWTPQGWLYVAAVVDLFSRRVVDEREDDGAVRCGCADHGDLVKRPARRFAAPFRSR